MSRGLRAVAGVGLIALAVFVPGGFIAANALAIGLFGASLVIGAVLQETPQNARRLQEQSVLIRSAVQAQEIIYGTTRKSGVVTWFDTSGQDNKYLWFVVTVAEHEIDSYKSLWLDEVEIDIATQIDGSGYVTRSEFVDADTNKLVLTGFYTGEDVQTADADLVAAFTEWTTAHRGDGVAYFWVRLELDRSEGGTDPENPSANVWHKGYPRDISVTLDGALVYDPRLDDLNGGTGTHRVDTKSTWEWSENPVLCRCDYLRSTRFGPAYTSSEVDWTVIATQADICEELVDLPASGTQDRFTLNGVVTVDDTPKNILEAMQTSDYGTTLFLPSGLELLVGSWDASSHTIDNTWLAGPMSTVSSVPTDDAYNAVRGQYLSADDDYTLVEFDPRLSSAYETEDGIGRVWQDVVLPFTVNEFTAQRLAIIELKRSRQQTAVRLQLNFRGELVEIFQIVTLDLPGFQGLNDSPEDPDTFRVIGRATSTDGTTSLDLREEVETDWNYTVPDLATPPIVPTVSRDPDGVPAPTNLTASSVPSGVQLFWDLPKVGDISHIEIYASATDLRSTVTLIGKALTDTYFHELTADAVRYYWILSRGNNGMTSSWEPDSTSGVQGTGGSSGVDGLSIVVANAYLRKALPAPSTPAVDDGAYDFDTNTLTPPGTPDSDQDWFVEPPAGTLPLYVTTGTFSIIGQSGSDGTVTWTAPDILVSDGQPGDSLHVANAFVRSQTAPDTPIADDGEYSFTTQTLTPPSISGGSSHDWETTPPTGVDPLWVTSGTFSISGTTGIDGSVVWSSPDLITHDGAGFVPNFSPGYVGGTSDFVYALNVWFDFTPNDGEIRVAGNTFEHPDGTSVTLATSPMMLLTHYEGGTTGTFYIMFSAVVGGTRFGGGTWGTSGYKDERFIRAVHDDSNGWRAVDISGTFFAMTVIDTDCIIAICTKENATGGIETIQVLTGGLAGIDAVKYYIKPTDGTAIKNGTGTLTIEAHEVIGATDSLISSGTIVLYDPLDNIVNVANGYATGSDGYTGVLDAGDIDNSKVITLKDGTGGTVLDTITLVDIADGGDGVYGYIEASGGLAWTRAINEGAWSPVATTTILTAYFVQSGAALGSYPRTVTRDVDGILTATGGTSGSITCVVTNNSTQAITLTFTYDDGTYAVTVGETVLTSIGGSDGNSGLDGITYFMSNENSGIAADSTGAVVLAGLANTGTSLQVKEGTTSLTHETGTLSAGEFKVNSRSTQSPTGMTVPALTGDGTATATAPSLTAWTDTTDTVGYIDWEIGIMRVGSSTEENFTIKQTFTITRSGPAGGTTANVTLRSVSANAGSGTTTQGFRVDSDGTIDATTLTSGVYTNQYTWLNSGTNSDFEVKMVYESGISTGFSGTLDTWLSCGSDNTWSKTSAAGLWVGTVTIREKDTGVTWSATVELDNTTA